MVSEKFFQIKHHNHTKKYREKGTQEYKNMRISQKHTKNNKIIEKHRNSLRKHANLLTDMKLESDTDVDILFGLIEWKVFSCFVWSLVLPNVNEIVSHPTPLHPKSHVISLSFSFHTH